MKYFKDKIIIYRLITHAEATKSRHYQNNNYKLFVDFSFSHCL